MTNMTPKEKTAELIDKMYYIGRYDDKEDYNPAMAWHRAKQCAIIAVDEILKAHLFDLDEKEYWQQVRTEIENL